MKEEDKTEEEEEHKSLCPRGLQCLDCAKGEACTTHSCANGDLECVDPKSKDCAFVCISDGKRICACPFRKYLKERVESD